MCTFSFEYIYVHIIKLRFIIMYISKYGISLTDYVVPGHGYDGAWILGGSSSRTSLPGSNQGYEQPLHFHRSGVSFRPCGPYWE